MGKEGVRGLKNWVIFMDVIFVSSLTLNKEISVQPIELLIFLRSNDKGVLSLK